MRASKTLISSAAAAAIVSVIGLAYAETSSTGDTAQMQAQTRDDTSTSSVANDASTVPTGTMQSSDTPSAPLAPTAGGVEAGSASGEGGTTSMPAPSRMAPTRSGNTGAATDSPVNRSNNGGDYNASSNSVAPAGADRSTDAMPSDPSAMPAERPAKPDRN